MARLPNLPHGRSLTLALGWLVGGAGIRLAGTPGGAVSLLLLLLGRMGLVCHLRRRGLQCAVPEDAEVASQIAALKAELASAYRQLESSRATAEALKAELASLRTAPAPPAPDGHAQPRLWPNSSSPSRSPRPISSSASISMPASASALALEAVGAAGGAARSDG